jgi:hypothetical protein
MGRHGDLARHRTIGSPSAPSGGNAFHHRHEGGQNPDLQDMAREGLPDLAGQVAAFGKIGDPHGRADFARLLGNVGDN